MGGIGILFSFLLSLVICGRVVGIFNEIWFIYVGLVIIFFVGMCDDILDLRAYYKLFGQLIAALIVVICGDIRITSFYGFLGVGILPIYVSYFFSIFVLLATSNAFNLIDGVDGLAGTISVIGLTFLGIWFSIHGLEAFLILTFSLLGAILAFLIYNWQPAKIFMGDTGALTLGFVIGVLVIVFFKTNELSVIPWLGKFNSPFTMGIALIIYPLFDMIRVFVRRIVKGHHPMKADRGHIHHFLLRSGLSHQKVTLIISIVQLALVAFGIVLKSLKDNYSMIILILVVLILGVIIERYTFHQIKKRVFSSSKS